MKTQTLFLFCFLTVMQAFSQDWNGVAVPADPGNGKTWKLQSISDSFNYTANPTGKPSQFTSRWKDSYIDNWFGPSLTEWNPGHVWASDGILAIQAHQKEGSNKILMGCMSSKQTVKFPLFLEARVRLANCTLANNIWMLSPDLTQEIDILEAYPTDRSGQEWFDQRIHLSHHVFIRNPFQDYQPRDSEDVPGTWHFENSRDTWRGDWLRIGVYWKNPWHLEYYIDGKLVRTIKKNSHSYLDGDGNTVNETRNFNIIDKYNYTNGTGLNKGMHIIINMEQQSWRTDAGIVPNATELNDANNRNIFGIDWVRVYKPISSGNGGGGTGNSYNIASVKSRKWISPLNGSSGNGVAIVNHPVREGNAREWSFVDKGNGFAEIKNVRSGRCIGVAGGSVANGAKLVQWNCNNSDDQRWKRVDRGNGQFSFVNKKSGRCIDLSAGNIANNIQFQQWNCNASNQNQRFWILSPGKVFSDDLPFDSNDTTSLASFTYPNPTSDILNISKLAKGSRDLKIINMFGKIIIDMNIKSTDDDLILNVGDLPSGMYLLKIDGNQVIKFAKQ
ncbi:RICIN domain-containing protein [Aquimarina sp. RZ0]|uniref:RICIN domain-containing protein n=1 Tax=Aquimarina sp. RZ0 TaxID=2607730 RepID=UPI0011F221A6|nr:RICIN domain-containing protein [Aquimarina sp. RZ0]KAA1243452.1 T9SS type A sorting domain-containing protein [Aquimarina sp. RZ0]